MKKENVYTSENSKKEVIQMTNIQAPYSRQQLLKWSAFRVEETNTDGKYYNLIRTPLKELVNQPGYTQFKARLNWLYNNYSEDNYRIVFTEIQMVNETRRNAYVQKALIAEADAKLAKEMRRITYHYGEIPQWVKNLNDAQHKLLLDRARTCYGLEPEYIALQTKEAYRVPQQLVKDYNEYGEPEYYTAEELAKTNFAVDTYNEVIGKFKFYSDALNKIAEQAVIRDAKWYAQFNDTDNDLRSTIEVPDTSDFEERMAEATAYVIKHKGKMPAKELVATALYLYNIQPDEYNKNTMKPITCIEDTYLGRDEEFVDFQCDIYGLDENGDLFTSHKKFPWSEE